jgi:chloramphenicol-sensitive protein RarD
LKSESGSPAAGVLLALAAYGIWGVAPVYWKALGSLPAVELLAQRVVWSCALGVLLVSATRAWPALRSIFGNPKLVRRFLLTSALIGCNWLTFVWAVLHDQIVATSLGYYITPLVHVSLGVLVLRERLRRLQAFAIAVAALGILQLALSVGEMPWITLVLAFSFGFYGLFRKLAPVEPVVGFAVETLVLLVAAAGTLVWIASRGETHFPTGTLRIDALVVGSGVFTAAPLICFNAAARRMRLSTLGFFQYVAPSISFVIAIGVYDEAFGRSEAITFACVALALALYSVDSLRSVSYESART